MRGEIRKPNPDETDATQARRAIRTYGERITRRELRQAFSQLEANGSLTDEQRATVSQMASAIVGSLLAPTLDALDEHSTCDDAVRTAVELYDADDPSGSL